MSKQGTVGTPNLFVFLLLFPLLFFSTSSYAQSDSDDLSVVACLSVQDLLSGPSLELVVLLCSISEGDAPVLVEHVDESIEQKKSEMQLVDTPVDTKHQLSLWMALRSRS